MKFLRLFILAIAVVLLVRTFLFSSCTIPSSGMENSLYRGDRVIVNKWSYGYRIPFMSLFSYHRIAGSPVSRGEIVVFNNPLPVQGKSIDRKEIYISRCVGLPGDTLMLDDQLMLTSDGVFSPDSKMLYAYPPGKEDTLAAALEKLHIRKNELLGCNGQEFIRSFSPYEIYLIRQELGDEIGLKELNAESRTRSHPFVVPRKGVAVRVYPWNAKLLRNTIVCHEGKQAEVRNDTLLVEGRQTDFYRFGKDYYWMASNNSVNLSDSRLFGLVPRDHLIGEASLVWFSKVPDTGLFGGYRWDRFFQSVK